MRQGAGDLDPDGAEDDAPDPALRFHDAARLDRDDLVEEGDQEGQGADRADESLGEEHPVVDERLELWHADQPSAARIDAHTTTWQRQEKSTGRASSSDLMRPPLRPPAPQAPIHRYYTDLWGEVNCAADHPRAMSINLQRCWRPQAHGRRSSVA